MSPNPELPEGALLTNGPGDLPQLRLTTNSCSAIVSLYGGQVLGWTPARTTPVLWLSPKTVYERGTALRGGIPICAPWFGPGLDGHRTPAHGWMRTALWELDEVLIDGESIVATLSLDGRVMDLGPASARVRIRAAAQLDVELTLTAHEEQTVEAALHTYLAVEDVRAIGIDGLQGIAYHERAGGQSVHGHDAAPLTFTAEVDRIYDTDQGCTVVDPGFKRRLVVDKRGSASTIVWNPSVEKSSGMKDMLPEGWSQFVCVEAGNVAAAAVTLAAGESLTMGTTISVAEL